jgi:nitric oxide reductase NorD protein
VNAGAPAATAPAPATDLPGRLHLSDVQRLLGLFAQGIAGRMLQLRPVDALPGTRPRGPTTDGHTLYLPETVAVFDSARLNLGYYRIAILHQVGLLARGTCAFSMAAARSRLRGLPDRSPEVPADAPDLEHFFGLWGAPALMQAVFCALEDLRIDRGLRRDYPGARTDLDRVLRQALAQRAPLEGLATFEALREGLVRFTLGDAPQTLLAEYAAADRHPASAPLMQALLTAAAAVDRDDADVIDSAGAAMTVYRILTRAGAPRPPPPAWETARNETSEVSEGAGEANPGEADDDADGPVDPDALSAFAVAFRGDAQPHLVQRQLRGRGMVGSIDSLGDSPSNDTTDDTQTTQREQAARAQRADHAALRRAFGRIDDGARVWLYDEWDHPNQRWLKGWCRLLERRLTGGDPAFLQTVHERHPGLAHRIREQFRQLRPMSLERIRRVLDGDELDLDGIVEAVIDRRAGRSGDDRVHIRRQPGQRDVAAAFLLDMSASTDFQIVDPNAAPEADAPEESEEDMPYLWNFARPDATTPEPAKRRVIDIARESLALMSEALDGLGDRHAIYGFSGYGRDEVEFFVARDFDDRAPARGRAAISMMEPRRSTRMGPAIRHAVARLGRQEARLQVLLIVSDGFPEDTDYGPDRNDREYGIQDTAMALREAQRAGIEAFCITVDRAGHDYLRRMCAEDRYQVIDEVIDLPDALAGIYRRLTT